MSDDRTSQTEIDDMNLKGKSETKEAGERGRGGGEERKKREIEEGGKGERGEKVGLGEREKNGVRHIDTY